MVAMGHIPDDTLGFDASGVIIATGNRVTQLKVGDHVCTLGHGTHRSIFRNKASFCMLIPEGMSFEAAATLPLVHCTAYNALVRVARAQPGQSVLIHAAAGGVGQSAIQIAQHVGMEIFATVGSPDKRQLLRDKYGIAEDHIFSSRDLGFAKGVKRMTGGRGVDVVLNSLSGEALRQTWYCIAPFGTFVEIGLKDIVSNSGLDMRPFLQDATFSFFNLSHLMKKNSKLMESILEGTFDLLRRGIIVPVTPLTVFPISKVEDAFRTMQIGKHCGKIALSWCEDEVIPVVQNPRKTLKLDSDATYVLVGGLGGLGRSLATFLANHGARHLCFVSRSGPSSVKAQKLIQELQKRQVHVKVYSGDIADKGSLANVLTQCSKDLPRIRGVVQCAMVLRDVLFEKMTHQQWQESLRPKVDGSANLDLLLPHDLDFFIMLSSFVGVFGNRTQSNYAASGAFQDALAYSRRAQGLKAVTIDLSIMRDIGHIAEHGSIGHFKEWDGLLGIRETEFHALMKMVLSSELANDGDMPPQILTGFVTGGAARAAGIRRPFYLDDPKFSVLAETGKGPQTLSGTPKNKARVLQEAMSKAETLADAVQIVIDALIARVAKSFQTPASEIDPSRPLHSYGVDSLVAIEIRNWIFYDFKSNVSLFDILATVPMTTLAETVASKCEVLPEGACKQ